MDKKKLGKLGEDIAKNYLIKKGYKILALNYQPPFSGKKFGEIDIIAREKSLFHKTPICFIEVKTVLENSYFSPEDRVDFLKKKKLKKLAEIYLIDKKISLDIKYQIDIIGIKINPITKKPKISHFENTIEN